MTCNPRTCHRDIDPIVSSMWITKTEERFDTSKCANKDNVVYVVAMFKNEGLY